ncbi:MAG: aspartate carbamoyltransferase [Kiritimatiellae bacterium]|nr:aspartate carbamoyltransferase [Kiritimatiellia bacterium]
MAEKNNRLVDISWKEFDKLGPNERAPYFNDNGRVFHALLAQQFDRPALDRLCDLATNIRKIAKSKEGMQFLQSLLNHKRVMFYFTQPSSRTYLSFCAACKILGMAAADVRDAATSSEMKGESQEDSVRTFSSYFDMIVMRSKTSGLAEKMAWVLANSERPIPIINAGSAQDQHPTQALLDVYTLERSFEHLGGVDGKSILFVGDLKRGRTVRSLSILLTKFREVTQFFVAPKRFQLKPDSQKILKEAGVTFELSGNFERYVPKADAIYMTRVQDEWDKKPGQSRKSDIVKYHFKVRHLRLLRPHAILMHPFPRREEIEVDVDHDPRAMYWRQMRNGMWVRVALIATIFQCDTEVLAYYRKHLG